MSTSKIFVANKAGTTRYLGRGYEGGQLTHYRGFSEDLRPHKARVEALAKDAKESRHGMRYVGSVPRIVIDDWLRKQGKTWHDYVTDKDLKAKFMAWFRSEYKHMTASNYQERSLATNRATSGGRSVTAPKLGETILKNYQRENVA